MSSSTYWNCTWPRFGRQCQYQFYQSVSDYTSLNRLFESFYSKFLHTPMNLTCYILLNCSRHCLQWNEICDGEVQCLDTGEDEKHCWQLETNDCKSDEYRCRNGQCLPNKHFESSQPSSECLDESDRQRQQSSMLTVCSRYFMPSFKCEDTVCEHLLFTSTCTTMYVSDIINEIFLDTNEFVQENCLFTVKCLIMMVHTLDQACRHICLNYTCIKIANESCPNVIFLGRDTDKFGDIHFIFQKTMISTENIGLLYICYRNSVYDTYFPLNAYVIFNESKCLFHEIITYRVNEIYFEDKSSTTPIHKLYDKLRRFYTIPDEILTMCNQSNIYRCQNSSKCISIYRINDGVNNCPYMDDENMIDIQDMNILDRLNKIYYKCQASNKYIDHVLFENGNCDCGLLENDWCEDEDIELNSIRQKIVFQLICDGFQEHRSLIIDGQNHTDETECQQWECDNLYTRCDHIWNCPKGDDEAGCLSISGIQCPLKQHQCLSSQTNQLTCLPLEQINDGHVDCLGGTDEVLLCRKTYKNTYNSSFYCDNMCLDSWKLCDDKRDCSNGEDEQFCTKNPADLNDFQFCSQYNTYDGSINEKFLCDYFNRHIKYSTVMIEFEREFQLSTNPVADSFQMQNYNPNDLRCHRGVDLLVWLDFDKKLSTRTCLCPPSFYGPLCQYQNQRVALTVRFRALADSWQTLFSIVISLIDDKRTIHSYEQISFLWQIDCQTSFQFYLLYSNQLKDLTKNYSIQIDFYEKDSLTYRGSSLFPVQFLFLPVNRMSITADIPRTDDQNRACSDRICVHGECVRYYNHSQGRTFCHCDDGWSGDDCSIQMNCTCSLTSHCIGMLPNNRSICVCRTNQFGSRCFLNHIVCENKINANCLHEGRCIANDGYTSTENSFVCICKDGYIGDRCEIVLDRLVISFDENLSVSPLIYIHFIAKTVSFVLSRTTIFRTIRPHQDLILPMLFGQARLMFIEFLNKKYYFIDLSLNYLVNTTISELNRCPNISELFNETFLQWHLIRRIKYYHLPCKNVNLSCFHDGEHFCLCYPLNGKRLANCFRFDHNVTLDCDGRSECENDGKCFQDDKICPQRSICLCESCYYGQRCQFSTSGFGLSLDAILGYHIESDLNLSQQSSIVKFSLTLTIILVLVGLTDGFLSLITFKNKLVRDVGCGIYLFCSAITTLLTSIILLLKFSILLSTQMKNISNRIFLEIQCHSVDFLLRICLHLYQWLTACIAVERAFTIFKEIRFDKKKSRQSAKYIIIILLFFLSITSIQDPIHRHLTDEKNDENGEVKRIWCTATYSSKFIRQFNSYMHTFHFLMPFTINLISTIFLITFKSRQQARLHKNQSYKQILREQYKQHKHLLIAPIVLVLLALPRLILTSITECMQSSDDAWLYIILYFISFLPSMLTSIVFILPSKFYKDQFGKSLAEYRTTIQRHLHLI